MELKKSGDNLKKTVLMLFAGWQKVKEEKNESVCRICFGEYRCVKNFVVEYSFRR